jgi:single-stranded-DNA-specific exonuclease
LHATRVGEFRERFNRYASERLTPSDFHPQLAIDAVLTLTELNVETAAELLALAPFGFGNPAPVLAVRPTAHAA